MAKKPKSQNIKTKKPLARTHREAQQIRLIVIVSVVVGIIILGLVGYGAIDQLVVRPRKPVAEVGDTVIRVSEYQSYVQYTRAQLLNQTFQYYTFYQQFGEFGASFLQTAQSLASQLAQPETLARSVLDEMIDNQVIKDEAEKMGITASDAEVDEAIQTAFGFFPDGTPTPTMTVTVQPTPTLSETQLAFVTPTSTPTQIESDDTEVEVTPNQSEQDEDNEVSADTDETSEDPEDAQTDDTASAELETIDDLDTETILPTETLTPTPYTTQAFGENIAEFNRGYSAYNFGISNLREIFRVQILREKMTEIITADLAPLRDEIWARHILVETEETASEVLERLEQNEDFAKLAAEYSTDESNRERGGDLGWFNDTTMVAPFSEAAFNLNVGDISDPIETGFGFHIIQVLGKREAQIMPNEFEQIKSIEFNTWLSEQRNLRDDIIIYDEWERNVPRTPELPQQLMVELFQQQQNIMPQIIP